LKTTIRKWLGCLHRWYNGIMSSRELYNEFKAAQTTGLFLKLNGGTENLLKLIKLLYAVERESINRQLCPYTYDKLVSMPHGQVVSNTYDNIKSKSPEGIWKECFKVTSDGKEKTVHLLRDCGIEKLSRADIALITETYQNNIAKTPEDLEREHHDPKIMPEYVDPHGSSIKTDYATLLRILGKNQTEIDDFHSDLKEMAFIHSIEC
jgi:uncharacterized phage-associated protein